jgi:hypothetical protein
VLGRTRTQQQKHHKQQTEETQQKQGTMYEEDEVDMPFGPEDVQFTKDWYTRLTKTPNDAAAARGKPVSSRLYYSPLETRDLPREDAFSSGLVKRSQRPAYHDVRSATP